jgi:hypothetical protein
LIGLKVGGAVVALALRVGGNRIVEDDALALPHLLVVGEKNNLSLTIGPPSVLAKLIALQNVLRRAGKSSYGASAASLRRN